MDTPDTPVKVTKQFRKELDEILQRLKKESSHHDQPSAGIAVSPTARSSRERSLAATKLQEAIMWLGMDLKAQNEPNPYPNSKDPSNDKIEPTADGLKM